jgi:hypothetical protein
MKEYFYTITEGMINLGLRGTELNLFAIIFGYSQKGDGCCYASRKELARRCGVSSTNTIDTAMDRLIERGLVKKFTIHKEGHDLVAYSYRAEIAQGTQNLSTPTQKLSSPIPKNCAGGYAKIAHIDNKEEIKEEKDSSSEQPSIPPPFQEVVKYCRERGFADPEGFADYYLENQKQGGWKRKDGKAITNWKQNVLQWERYNKNKTFPRTTNNQTISVQQAKSKYGL